MSRYSTMSTIQGIEHELMMAAIEASRDGVVITDASTQLNRIVYTNTAFQKMVGFSEQELLNKGTRFLLGKKTRPSTAATFRQALADKASVRVTLSAVCKNGEEKWIEISGGPIPFNGEVGPFFIGFCRDVTNRVNAFEALMASEIQYDVQEEVQPVRPYDPVTSLYNRPYFDEVAERDWIAMEQERRPLSVFIMGVSGISGVLNNAGQVAADDLMQGVARSLRQVFRRGVDLVARYDAQRFVVISAGMGWEEAEVMAQNLNHMVGQELSSHPMCEPYHLHLTMGLATLIPEKGYQIEALMTAAEDAYDEAAKTRVSYVIRDVVGLERREEATAT